MITIDSSESVRIHLNSYKSRATRTRCVNIAQRELHSLQILERSLTLDGRFDKADHLEITLKSPY